MTDFIKPSNSWPRTTFYQFRDRMYEPRITNNINFGLPEVATNISTSSGVEEDLIDITGKGVLHMAGLAAYYLQTYNNNFKLYVDGVEIAESGDVKITVVDSINYMGLIIGRAGFEHSVGSGQGFTPYPENIYFRQSLRLTVTPATGQTMNSVYAWYELVQ